MPQWDTKGTEKFRAITQSFYHLADGIFLVFDLTSNDTFHNLSRWLVEITKYNSQAQFMLVGNKSDLIKERIVSLEAAKAFQRENEGTISDYHEVSAKTGDNVREIFESMARLMYQRQADS